MNESFLRAWGLAALSYDEVNITKHVDFLFREYHTEDGEPHYEQHWIKGSNGHYFFGIVVDWVKSIAYLPCRGTDGDNLLGKIQSWATNANARTGDNDIADGCENEGNIWFDEFKRLLPRVKIIVTSGHSQGAYVQQYMAKLCCENLSADKLIFSHGFSTPPWCKGPTAGIMLGYIHSARLKAWRYSHKRDPVCSKWLYDKTGAQPVGDEVFLPCPLDYEMGPGNAFVHSVRLYNSSIMIHGAQTNMFDIKQMWVLGEIAERCVN